MKNEGTREMVLQTTLALLSMGLAVMSYHAHGAAGSRPPSPET